jgi:importin subunit alpha-6/7
VSRGCLEPLCRILMCQDSDLVYTCLEGLQNILKAGEAGKKGQDSGTNTNPYAEFILECRGLDILEDLQDVGNDRIYKLVMELLESYWEEEVSDDPDVPGSTPKEAAAAQPPIPSSSADEAN